MPKKTTILIVILAIITGILIFVAVRSDQSQVTDQITGTAARPTPAATKPFASLSFSPPIIDAHSGPGTEKIDIILDTRGNKVAGAQVELSYDPTILTNVTLNPLVPDQLFGSNPTVLISSVDKTQGRITYAITISGNDSEKIGKASILSISFTINRFSGTPATQISFLAKSAVTTLDPRNGSVLKSTTPLKIMLTSPPSITPGS